MEYIHKQDKNILFTKLTKLKYTAVRESIDFTNKIFNNKHFNAIHTIKMENRHGEN